MSILAWIEDQKRLKLLNAPKYVNPASDSSKGLWTRCDKCGVILYIKHLKENQRVCFGCSYHLQMSSQERVENLLDKDSWRPLDETVSPCDPLEFHDQKDYTDRLQEAQERTGLQDAIQTGSGMVDGIPIALGVMDFDFMGGSMGSVVGEKVTRLIEYATQEGLTLVLVCASGGARMQEGVLSLMQMAKISSALQVYQACANLLYISILTSPTTGGVTASFAMLGDIIFAEPKALVAFAGRRVIEQTLCEDLPEDFQTSEYMLHHGLLDLIVPRRFFRQALSESIRLYKNAPFKKAGRIPFGVQNPITFVVEERIRRRWAFGNAPIANRLSHLWAKSRAKNKDADYAKVHAHPDTHLSSIPTPGVGMPPESSNSEVESTQSRLEDTGLSYGRALSNRDNYNGSTKAVSSADAKGAVHADVSVQSKQKNKPLKDGTFKEGDVQTKDKSKQTDNLETAPVETSLPSAQAQEKSVLKRATQSVESATLDTSLQKEDSLALSIAPKENELQVATASVSSSFDSLLQREATDYRDILTSFQTMFNLFSKELIVPYASPCANSKADEYKENQTVLGMKRGADLEQAAPEISSGDWNASSISEEATNLSGMERIGVERPGVETPKVETSMRMRRGTSTPDVLLQSFFNLSERQSLKQVEHVHPGSLHVTPETQIEDVSVDNRAKHAAQPQAAKTEIQEINKTLSQNKHDASLSANSDGATAGYQTSEQLSMYRDILPSLENNKELTNSPSVETPSVYVDFLNQSIELAATESVEWRAFYLHQRISQTTGFVEDLAQSLPGYAKGSNEIAFQNMLFYRSICRKLV